MYGEAIGSAIGGFTCGPIPTKTINLDKPIDNVNSPAHYSHNRKGIECIQAIEASMTKHQFIGWLKGQIIKYAWRFDYKGKPLEDCKKAEFYLKRLIKELENEGSKN